MDSSHCSLSSTKLEFLFLLVIYKVYMFQLVSIHILAKQGNKKDIVSKISLFKYLYHSHIVITEFI